MKNAYYPHHHPESEDSTNTGRLELLCHTAIMQDSQMTTSEGTLSSSTSPSSRDSANEASGLQDFSKSTPPSFVTTMQVCVPVLSPASVDAQLASRKSQPGESSSHISVKAAMRENVQLKIELGEAKKEIACLKKEIARNSCNIRELRSFSAGNKISEIPLADMIEIMKEYGSEISSQSFQKRKEDPQPASIVRQFRRWNPEFLNFFNCKDGKWVPKLGKAGELKRRKKKREALRAHRRNPPSPKEVRVTGLLTGRRYFISSAASKFA